MTLSPSRVASLHLAAAAEVWLPDYLGPGAAVADATMRLIKEIVVGTSTEPKYRSSPQAVAGGLLYHMLRDSANLEDDARHMFPILDRNAGLHTGGDMWRHAERVYHALMRGGVPSDKGQKALRIGGLGVELLQRTRQPSKAQIVNSYFVKKYADDLVSMQPGRDKAPLPSEALREHIDAEMASEAQQAAALLRNNPQKALAFLAYVLMDVNFHDLSLRVSALGPTVPLSEDETQAAREIAGFVQYGVEEAAAFGLALLEAIGVTALAAKYEKAAIQIGKESGLFTNRLAGDAYKGNPDGQGIYPNEIDHGYVEPLAGGTDVMRKLQNQFLHEQGRDPRPESPRLAAGPSSGTIEVSVRADRMYFAARRLFGSAKFKDLNQHGTSFVESMISFVRDLKEEAASTGVAPGWKTAQAHDDVEHLDDVLVSGFAPGGFMEVRSSILATGNFTDQDAAWRILNTSAKKHGFKLK